MKGSTAATFFALSLTLVTACAPPTSQSTSQAGSQAPQAKKQIVASIFSQPAGLHQEVTNPTPSAGSIPGLAELYAILNAGLTHFETDSARHPWFAEAVPSSDNGLWQVFPDGRMETTWKLKPGIKWHDGAPYTSDDLRFTLDVYRDKEIGAVAIAFLPLIDGVETPDSQTLVLKWTRPFVDADGMFTPGSSGGVIGRIPTTWTMPKHLLAQPFQDNKANFFSLPYWREGFIGAGPFKMVDWVEGTHAVLSANNEYVLGRPHLDQVTVQFFSDKSAIKAALLAAAVQVHMGRAFNVDDVLEIQNTTQDVKVQLGGTLAGVLPIYPQAIDPDPPVVGNVQFRRAMLMAIDRQEMTDQLNNGLGPVAHSWVQADQAEGRAVEPNIVRYPYDPRAAAQMIQDLGYTKGADGFFHSADGTKLSVGILTHEQNSFHVPGSLSVQTYWQRLGVDVQLEVLPAARATDLKARALFPSFIFLSKGAIASPDGYFNRASIPTADNNYAGGNAGRYGSADLDALIERYLRTIPFPERMAALGEMVHFQTDQLTMLPLFFQGAAYVVGSTKLKNALASFVWNADQWDLD